MAAILCPCYLRATGKADITGDEEMVKVGEQS
jgi:hypothetical protein